MAIKSDSYLTSLFGLEGKTIVVTGAGGGIGLAISEGLLRAGAEVALCNRTTAKCKPLACRILGWGSVNAAGVPIRKIVEFALSVNATSVVLAHNHPSGIALPSQADIAATERLSTALDAVGIVLADHIIVSDEDFVSMAASGVYRPPQSPALPR